MEMNEDEEFLSMGVMMKDIVKEYACLDRDIFCSTRSTIVME
jgi:hypothetical protein